ncbi:hypothetical protein L6R50_22285 [Myxococcota bacterium]|nr:hypothetical protein [Myxococcota bacterium]
MNPSPLALAAALATAALLAGSRPAAAALPIGFDLGVGAGARGSMKDWRPATLDVRVNADLRLGILTLGGEFRDQPPVFGAGADNYALGYFNLGLNLPLPKGRIALRGGIGGGSAAGTSLLGFHESVGLHVFPKGPAGFGFQVDFDQTFDTETFTPDHGAAGNVMFLVRL